MANDEHQQQALLDELWRRKVLSDEERGTADRLEVSMEAILSNNKMMIHLLYLKRAMMIMEGMIQRFMSGLILYNISTNPFRAN